MKKTICTLIALLVVFLPLAGCSEQAGSRGAMGSEIWETMPQLTYGEMEYEKLRVLPWNCGRCEATSFSTMAETEKGYYTFFDVPVLQYADKADPGLWVPVCGKPACKHTDSYCPARLASNSFVIQNDRIYYPHHKTNTSVAYSGEAELFLASMAADGSDKRVEFAFEEFVPNSVSFSTCFLSPYSWNYNVVELNPDGTSTAHAFRATKDGKEKLATVDNWEGYAFLSPGWFQSSLWGDPLFSNGILNSSRSVLFRDNGNTLEQVDTTELPVKNAYLSGSILRFFRVNDGYYDRNIKTGEEVKLADAQLANSFASIVLPNCILESTLMAYLAENSDKYYEEGMRHTMRLFDGEAWRDVALPEELVNANALTFLKVHCVASDCIILLSRDLSTYKADRVTDYYRIDLEADTLRLEHFLAYQGRTSYEESVND